MLTVFSRIFASQHKSVILKACISGGVNEKWDLLTSVCLERKPIISPSLNKLETEFQKYLLQIELERSLKSDNEIRHENDKKKAELIKKGSIDVDLDAVQLQTAQDFKDACVEELNKFEFASRVTEADKKNDVTSLERKLDKYLLLLTNQQIGNKKYFLPPQGVRKDGETLRQTAERILKESCGDQLKVKFYGNAPVGFYKYKYPKPAQQNGTVGAKIFFYFARYLDGEPTGNSKYKWLDRIELSKEVPKDYHNSLAKFLIDDNCNETNISK